MKNTRNSILILLCFIVVACTPGEDLDPTGDDGLVYYDYTGFYRMNDAPFIDTIDYKTVCFNLKTGTVVWEKEHSKIMPDRYPDYWNGHNYTNALETSTDLVRIIPLSSNSYDAQTIPSRVEGVYYQRINKATGGETLINIVPSSEIPRLSGFWVSRAVSDGQCIYFHAVNNTVYCLRMDGTIKWKRTGLVPGNVIGSGSGQRSYLYLYNNRIYTVYYDVSIDGRILIAMNKETGNTEDERFASYYTPNSRQFVFGSTHYIDVAGSNSPAVSLLKYTEQNWVGIHNNAGMPVGMWGDTSFLYINDRKVIRMDIREPRWKKEVNTNFSSDEHYIFDDNKIYAAGSDMNTRLFSMNVVGPDPQNNHMVWSKSYQFPQGTLPIVYSYILKGSKLYFFTDFQLHNNNLISNVSVDGASVIVVDAKNGNILNQYKGLPISRSKETAWLTKGIYHIVVN
jgi:hypothetical protein